MYSDELHQRRCDVLRAKRDAATTQPEFQRLDREYNNELNWRAGGATLAEAMRIVPNEQERLLLLSVRRLRAASEADQPSAHEELMYLLRAMVGE